MLRSLLILAGVVVGVLGAPSKRQLRARILAPSGVNERDFATDLGRFPRFLVDKLQPRSFFEGDDEDVLMVPGKVVSSNWDVIGHAFERSAPVILVNVDGETKQSVMQKYLPIQHTQEFGDSSMLLMDTFQDGNNNTHFFVMHLPAGSGSSDQVVEYANENGLEFHESFPALKDALALEVSANFSDLAADIWNQVEEYLDECAGFSLTEDDRVQRCWSYMKAVHGVGSKKPDEKLLLQHNDNENLDKPTMIPEDGAVWRELIETTFRLWEVQWGRPFPFEKKQTVSHRMNTYWYLYLQAPPFKELYYAFVLVDGLHNPNTQLSNRDAVGLYMSNLNINIHAERADGKRDNDNLIWIKSSPKTQNTQHTIGRSWESTDSYSFDMNLGFTGKVLSGGLKFNYTHTFTASYSESRDITDWSVVENTNPVAGTGQWKYYQSWPIDMMANSVDNSARNWEQYFEQSWNPCRVKDVPNLSKYALGTHNSMVWAVSPALRSRDLRHLPIKFVLSFFPKVTAHTCEVFDGHHKIAQSNVPFNDMGWNVNVADLNNIQWQ